MGSGPVNSTEKLEIMGGLAAGGASHITSSSVFPSVFLPAGFLDAGLGLGLGSMVTLTLLVSVVIWCCS